MAATHSGSPLPPHNPHERTWPTYRAEGLTIQVSVYLAPGIQVPGMTDTAGTFECGISGVRSQVTPGVGTLFLGSFENEEDAVPVSAAVMAMSHQQIRQMVIRYLLTETLLIQQRLTQILDALSAGDWERYLTQSHEADLMTALLNVRMNWMSGVMAIAGRSDDPIARHLATVRR